MRFNCSMYSAFQRLSVKKEGRTPNSVSCVDDMGHGNLLDISGYIQYIVRINGTCSPALGAAMRFNTEPRGLH